ncbi:hypothetical protein NBRC116588_30450 [Pyruvatibacter sp. HU-CL02332]|uniref:hypothetical protein n=1 Tax=Pyruvatibacter sp. HU-CL02332 TaxID=3127650 RepID=UPI003106E9C5
MILPHSFRPAWSTWLMTVAAFLLLYLPSASAQWFDFGEETSTHLTWELLEGSWKIFYLDDDLGGVSGEAKVDGQTVTITLVDPKNGQQTPTTAHSAAIEGDELVLTFMGPSPEDTRKTGEGYPDEMIAVDAPEITSITLKGGTEEVEAQVAPMPETDLDFVEVRLKPTSETALVGYWRYRVHPFLGRAQDGRGRAGGLEQDDDGVWWASGRESWQRHEPKVFGVVPIQDQLAKEMFSDGTNLPYYSYPFRPGAEDLGKMRTLFVFGRDLPHDWSRSIEIEGGSPGVTYHEIARLSDYESREAAREGYRREVAEDDHNMDDFVRGRKIVKDRLDESQAGNVDELDAVILRATIDDKVVPGWQTFKYGGSEAAWLLQFGDNTANMRIVRKVERLGDRHEPTGILYTGEIFRIEIETRFKLPVDQIPVVVASVAPGASLSTSAKKGMLIGDGEGIPAIRSTENPRIYRTEFIRNDPRVAADKSIQAGEGGAKTHIIHGGQGARVFAMISSPGIISIPPAMTQATIFNTPTDTAVGGSWNKWLAAAAACAGVENADRVVTERSEAATISEWLINSGRSRFPIPGSFESKVTVAQHAAMMLMRDTFARQMDRNRTGFSRIESDEEILAFRRAMEPIILQGQSPLTRIEVTGIDGQPTTFDWSFHKSTIGDVHDKRTSDIEAWALRATREALRKYIDLMFKTAKDAREIDECHVEDLLKLTGHDFDAVAALAKTKLMVPADKPLYWAPDYRARGHVDTVKFAADTVRIGEQLGEADRREAAMAVAIATIPVAIVGGMAGSSAAIVATFAVDVIDVGASTYAEISDKLGRDAEYDFAFAAADVIGMQRLQTAESRQRSWASVMGKLFPTVAFASIGILVDVPDIYKAFGEGLRITRIARGRRALAEGLEIEQAASAVPTRAKAVAEELEETLERARIAQAAGEAPTAPPNLRGSDPEIDAGLARPTRGVRFDELPDALTDSADDIFAYLDDLASSGVLSRLDDAVLESAESAGRRGDDAFAWEAGLSAESRALTDRLISRARTDVLDLMEEAGSRIARLLDNADPVKARYAREVLESDPGLSPEAFEKAVETLYKRRPREIGEDFFRQADPADRQISEALEQAGWRSELEIDGVDGGYKIYDPDRRAGEIIRSFDPSDGTFKMAYAKAEMTPRPRGPVIDGQFEVTPGFVRGKIDDILPVPNAGRGVPTIQYFTMRLMHKLGVQYGTEGVGAIKKTVMSGIANVRTITTLEYLRKLHMPNTPLADVPAEELSRWIMMTHSARYAEGVLAGTGYRVKKATVKIGTSSMNDPHPISVWSDFFDARSETLAQFLARHGFTEDTRMVGLFNIELEVVPF